MDCSGIDCLPWLIKKKIEKVNTDNHILAYEFMGLGIFLSLVKK
jgi:hypothetical protein